MQLLLIAGSVIALLAAIIFIVIGIIAMFRSGRPNAMYAFLFFALSMLILALYLFLWYFNFGRVGQETQAFTGPTPVNAGLGQLGQVLGGGIIAAIVALSLRETISWYRRPKVAIEFEKDGFCYGRKGDDPPDSYWLRVKVTNLGKSVARNCLGRLLEFKEDGDKEKPIDHDSVRLHWIDTPWQEGTQLFTTMDLHQGQYEFLDVLLTKKAGSPPNIFLFTGLKLGFDPGRPLTVKAKDEELPSEIRRIRIAVYGDNVKPCFKEYHIRWKENDPKYTDIWLEER